MLPRLVATVLLVIATAACSSRGDGHSAGGSPADCQTQIRSGGVDFTSYGSTTRQASRYGTAKSSTCDDVGEDVAGSVFTENSPQITTFKFAGHPPSQVLGVKSAHVDGFEVFVADSVSAEVRDRIYDDLD